MGDFILESNHNFPPFFLKIRGILIWIHHGKEVKTRSAGGATVFTPRDRDRGQKVH